MSIEIDMSTIPAVPDQSTVPGLCPSVAESFPCVMIIKLDAITVNMFWIDLVLFGPFPEMLFGLGIPEYDYVERFSIFVLPHISAGWSQAVLLPLCSLDPKPILVYRLLP
jgi:hypothetical protein